MDSPSSNSSSTSSGSDVQSSSLPRSLSELKGPSKSRFTLRRLSSPTVSSTVTKPAVRGRSSLPAIPKFSLVTKTRRALDRKSARVGDNYSESSRLTTCHSSSGFHYGSSSLKPKPSLHFTLFFCPTESRLTVTVLGLYRGSKKTSGAIVRVCLPPVCPTPLQGSSTRRRSLSPETPVHIFILQVKSEELYGCTLILTASSRDFSGLRETAVGEIQLMCAEIDWQPGSTVTLNRQLNTAGSSLRKVSREIWSKQQDVLLTCS